MVDAYGRHYPDYPGQQPYQDPQYMRWMHQQNQQLQMQPQQIQQTMTPPTIHAEIIQVDNEKDVERWPVNAGMSQMFFTRDETKIIIKTMSANGPLPLVIYEKLPPAPVEPAFDPSSFVRRDELPALIASAIQKLSEVNNGNIQQSRAAVTAESN